MIMQVVCWMCHYTSLVNRKILRHHVNKSRHCFQLRFIMKTVLMMTISTQITILIMKFMIRYMQHALQKYALLNILQTISFKKVQIKQDVVLVTISFIIVLFLAMSNYCYLVEDNTDFGHLQVLSLLHFPKTNIHPTNIHINYFHLFFSRRKKIQKNRNDLITTNVLFIVKI